jgi:signal transduction histidine kinase
VRARRTPKSTREVRGGRGSSSRHGADPRGARERYCALLEHIEDAREEERARLARELHDELGQALTVLKIDLALLESKVGARDGDLARLARTMMDLVDRTAATVRSIVTGLRPPVLDLLGLDAAIEWKTGELAPRVAPAISLRFSGGAPSDKRVASALYRIFEGALLNAVTHARARCIEVSLNSTRATHELRVRDDGVGISAAQVASPRSFGLMSMRERAAALGGELRVEGQEGRGTTVLARVPRAKGDAPPAPRRGRGRRP